MAVKAGAPHTDHDQNLSLLLGQCSWPSFALVLRPVKGCASCLPFGNGKAEPHGLVLENPLWT